MESAHKVARGYSSRNATMGSTCTARFAGSIVATNATPPNKSGTATNVTGSRAPMSYNRLDMNPVSQNAPTRPAATPTPAIVIPWRTTMPTTSPPLAPNARRKPNSWVRSEME